MGRPGVRRVIRTLGRFVLFGSGHLEGAGALAPMRRLRTLVSLHETLRLVGIEQRERTRDLGTGAGALVYALGLAGSPHVTGIDPFNDGDRTLSTEDVDEETTSSCFPTDSSTCPIP